MDLGVAPRCSRHLVGLPPSTSPPPLGERAKHSENTIHHFDSNRDLTIIHHGSEVPELPPSPPPVVEIETSSTYGTLHEFGPYGDGPSQEYLSQFHDYISSDPRYWLYYPGEETHHAPTSTGHIRYGMPDILDTGPTPHAESVGDPGTMHGGTSIPFHVERFGNSSHIAPSTPVVEIPSHTQPRPNTSVPLRGA